MQEMYSVSNSTNIFSCSDYNHSDDVSLVTFMVRSAQGKADDRCVFCCRYIEKNYQAIVCDRRFSCFVSFEIAADNREK